MGFCDKVRVDRVIADEIFYIQDLQEDTPIGEIVIPEGSEIGGTVTVTVLECEPIVDIDEDEEIDEIRARITFMIQKELDIETPEEDVIPLEFGFRLETEVTFRKVIPTELLEIDPDLLEDLRCHIVFVNGTDEVTLEATELDDEGLIEEQATFTEDLIIQLKLKLVQERQLVLALCPDRQQTDITVQPTPDLNAG